MYYFNETKTRPGALIIVVSIVTDVTHHLKYVTAPVASFVTNVKQYPLFSLQQDVFNVFYMSTWSKWTPNESFGI